VKKSHSIEKSYQRTCCDRVGEMDLISELDVAATRDIVWSAINDPTILRNPISGYEEREAPPDGGVPAAVRVKMRPVSARFRGRMTLSNLKPAASYTIEGEGPGDVAGSQK
jgi:carbon monoxide dehydrogenase subunit G